MTSAKFEQSSPNNLELATPANIYNQLRDIAVINQDFREGVSGTFSLSVEQGEPVRLSDFTSDDAEWPTPYITEEYNFEAKRVETGENSVELGFAFRFTTVAHNMRLPYYIAAYAYGAKKDPVAAAGPVRKVHFIHAEIDSSDYDLTVDEKVEFYDKDGDQVVDTSTFPYPEEEEGQTVIPQMPAGDASANGSGGQIINLASLTDSNVPIYFRNDAVKHLETSDDAPHIDELEDFINDLDHEHQQIVTAYHVLQSMKKAFHRQLGMQI